MKSIHTDENGKYVVAVYECEVFDNVTDAWIASLFPMKFGRSVTVFGIMRPEGATRWYMLIANARQTTRSDIINRLKKRLPSHKYTVHVSAAVPEISTADRTGTPRQGTKRLLPNAPHRQVVAAR